MWDYSEKVKDHFFHPRNARIVPDANAIGDVGSISCGDALRLMLKINPETEIIEDAGFQTFGCGSAIASSSALTEMIIGKKLEDALKVTNKDIADYLDGLPPEKMHCSVMGREALDAAAANYRGEEYVKDHSESPLICKCFGIEEDKIVKAIKENNLTTVQEITNYTKAGGACGACHEKIEDVLFRVLKEMEGETCNEAHKAAGGCEPSEIQFNMIEDKEPSTQKQDKVEDVTNKLKNEQLPFYQDIVDIIEEMRPALANDGGDITLIAVYENKVEVELSGACTGCMMTDMTLSWVQSKIMDVIGKYIQVVNVGVVEHNHPYTSDL